MTKVILINGPARSGKDTLADVLEDAQYEWASKKDLSYVLCRFKFAGMMHKMWREVFWDYLAPDEDTFLDYVDGSKKNEVFEPLGVSYRQAMIAFSEDFIKPLLGTSFFGRYTAQQIARQQLWYPKNELVAIISDSGFAEEAVAIIEKFGAENVLHIKLYREGFTFSGDSRNYIDLEPFGVESVELENITLEQFKRDGTEIVREFIERR